MSGTPRTDAAYFSNATLYDLAGEMKKLERELTAAQAEIARLKAGGCARDQRTTQFCGEAVKLQEENAKLQERVRRLKDFAMDIASNYDHDTDAHRHGTNCRVCEAEKAIDGPGTKDAQ